MTVSRHDIDWACRTYLGTGTEQAPPDLIAAILAGCRTPQDVRHAFYEHVTKAGTQLAPMMPDGYCAYRPGTPRLVILGNCQAPNLARAMSALVDCSVYGVEIMTYPANPAFFEKLLESADLVVAAILSDEWGILATDRLRERFGARLATFSGLHFDGLMPDLTYWGARADRTLSPLGDYHSKIVLRNFLSGRTVAECLADFTVARFEELDFFGQPERAFAEMRAREAGCTIQVHDDIRDRMADTPLFLTFNHPRQALFDILARKAAAAFDLPIAAGTSLYGYQHLPFDVIWPIYPEVARFHGIRFVGDDRYWKHGLAMTREEFVERSYIRYGAVARQVLLDSASDDQRRGVGLMA